MLCFQLFGWTNLEDVHLLFPRITSSVRLTCQEESPYFDFQRREKLQLQYLVLRRKLLPEPSVIIFILSSSFLNFITLQAVEVPPRLSYQCTLYSLCSCSSLLHWWKYHSLVSNCIYGFVLTAILADFSRKLIQEHYWVDGTILLWNSLASLLPHSVPEEAERECLLALLAVPLAYNFELFLYTVLILHHDIGKMLCLWLCIVLALFWQASNSNTSVSSLVEQPL